MSKEPRPEDWTPAKDCHELVSKTVGLMMKPLLTANFEEHQQTRKAVNDLVKVVSNRKEMNVVWGIITVYGLFFLMLFLTTCE